MIEPTGHCPFLGLKQNRAIRFAAPTPEHRCYVNGEPIDIPVDQANYCLSQGHVRCPLYMGLTFSTTGDATAPGERGRAVATGGVRGWLATLPARDRAIYLLMLALLLLIVAAYLALSLRSLLGGNGGVAGVATSSVLLPTVSAPATVPPASTVTATVPVPTPTNLPTSAPPPTATNAPTQPPLIFPPTRIPETLPPTADNQLPSTAAPPPTVASPTVAPATRVLPPASPVPISSIVPPPTRVPLSPTPAPPAVVSSERLTLYFGDQTGTLFVPVQRTAQIENQQIARAAVRELIAGSRTGLQRLLVPDAQLLDLTIRDGTATVNFDRPPTGPGDDRGLYAVVLTLTQFQSVRQVQFQVNGQNIGAPFVRPVVNPLNPQNLPADPNQTTFLPLYFPSVDGIHDVRVIRMVPRTNQVAEATMQALLEGPGRYEYAVQRVIPRETQLRGIRLDGTTITVDFTQPFAAATERDAAVRSVALALTTLPNVTGVQMLVEGRSLAEFWGATYGGVFGRPVINGE